MKVYHLILLIVAVVATVLIQDLKFNSMLENGYVDNCFKGDGKGTLVTGFYIKEKGRCYTNTP